MREATRSLQRAFGVWGGRGVPGGREAWGGACLTEALRLLEEPSAKSAAKALILIGDASRSCDQDALGVVKAAERAARDVIVVRCRSQADPGNQKEFLQAAEEAFGRRGRGLDRELEACLKLAHYKLRLRV